jgi:hypothetical protein
MNPMIGEKVIAEVNGVHKVGTIISKTKIKRGNTYALKLEDGKIIDVCSINKELSPYCHIKRGLTKSLNKIENDNVGQEEISNS